MEAEIRPARDTDLASIQALNQGLFEHDAEFDPRLILTWTYEETGSAYFASRIGGEGICLVAEIDGEVVAYLAGAICEDESYRKGRRSELENMCVAESLRNQAIGSALFDEFRKWSVAQGADELYVETAFDNTRAIAFYQKNGFKSFSHDLILEL